MKRLRLAVLVTGSLLGLSGLLLACLSDDDIVAPPGGVDGGADQNSPDSTDTKPDAGDASDADASPDAPLSVDSFAETLAETICRSLTRCCFGDATLGADGGVDGGVYDQKRCVDYYKQRGFQGSGNLPADKTHLVLDDAKAQDCLAKLETIPCNTPGATYTTVAKSCFGAIAGKRTAGESCGDSIECQANHFCLIGDAGTGTCSPLRGLNGNCGDWFANDDPQDNAEFSGQACSFRGNGVDTGLYCDFYDFDGGAFRPQMEWKCKSASSPPSDCANTSWCKDSLCDGTTNVCTTPKLFFPPSPPGSSDGCGTFVIPK